MSGQGDDKRSTGYDREKLQNRHLLRGPEHKGSNSKERWVERALK